MKKILSILLVAMLFLLPLTAKADLPNLVDTANVLDSSEAGSLLSRVNSISDEYEIDTIIVIIESLNGADCQAAADDIFDDPDYGYGYGDDYSGALLLYAVEDREIAISTYGKGISALSDYQIDRLLDTLVPYLRDGDVYSGLNAYLNQLENDYRNYYEGGYDEDNEPMPLLMKLIIGIIVGLIAASITVSSMKAKMQTAVRQSGAVDYIAPGSYDLYNSRDIFLYSHTSRTRRESSSGGGHSGGSTHHSSSGRSHGGGSRRF